MGTKQQLTQSAFPEFPRGMDLLNRNELNKGTAFTEEERIKLGLHGLLPPHLESLDEQVLRAYEAYKRKDDDLERHIYLRALQDTNEVLFYRLLLDHIEDFDLGRHARQDLNWSLTFLIGEMNFRPALHRFEHVLLTLRRRQVR